MKDVECESAIDNFKVTTSIPEWLVIYRDLYQSLLYGPDDLPKVVDMHFDGECFEGIRRFSLLYKTVLGVFE
jgi:hypothetical protein